MKTFMDLSRVSCLQEFISEEAVRLERRQLPNTPLIYVLDNRCVTVDGLWMEFGVYQGNTINKIASRTGKTVYGFDSFDGLPEDWREGMPQGRYTMHGELPNVKANVQLIPGWFDETLPEFLEEHPQNVAFLHIDCDLYSSTKTILLHLKDRIVEGTIVIFDELLNYPGYEKHEIKALYEFLKETHVQCEWIGIRGKISLVPDSIDEKKFYCGSQGVALRVLKAA